MIKNNLTIMKLFLMISDVIAVILSFSLAYYYRIHFDGRPYFFDPHTMNFVVLIITLVPVWLIVNVMSGLYDRAIFLYRPREYGRVIIASVVSVMALVSYAFFTGDDVFPVRIIAIYFIAISFFAIILGRELVKLINRVLIRNGIGRQKVLIVGSNEKTTEMANFLIHNIDYGYDIAGIVAKSDFLPREKCPRHFSNFNEAVEQAEVDVIIQTDNNRSEIIYDYAIEKHISYMFLPNQDRLISQLNSVEIIGGLPVIDIKITKLFGAGQFWKRLMDITGSLIGIIIALPIMTIVAIIMKIIAPKDSIFFRQIRLTKFNKEFYIYKFRSQKAEYDGLTPEQAFEKMNKPELIKKYRENGDSLDDDPRVTKIGKFIRATSLDELPQLFNVLKGDISLVGPRALIPQEINQYKKKDIILAVKSGVTGLAQVSGRRDISFEERRRLDVYYVQNWSILLDIQIIFKTIASVIFRRGAK